jgi:predicted RNA-binding protein YlqC (UPF0109 family)
MGLPRGVVVVATIVGGTAMRGLQGALPSENHTRGCIHSDCLINRGEWACRQCLLSREFRCVAAVEAVMKSLIEAIVRSLVDQPDEVQIKEVIGDHAHVLELRVAKEDLGKVIGKGGAHASAIRTLMAAASGKEKKRYILEIIEY